MRFSSHRDLIAAAVLGVLMVVALFFAPLLALGLVVLAIAVGIARGVVHERRVRGL
jgi:hypothetical protein